MNQLINQSINRSISFTSCSTKHISAMHEKTHRYRKMDKT